MTIGQKKPERFWIDMANQPTRELSTDFKSDIGTFTITYPEPPSIVIRELNLQEFYMNNQPPREFWIRQTEAILTKEVYWQVNGRGVWLENEEAVKKFIHVIEAGPVLEKIKRLEAALQKCKEQRGICTEIHANGLCLYQIMEKEIESTLEG